MKNGYLEKTWEINKKRQAYHSMCDCGCVLIKVTLDTFLFLLFVYSAPRKFFDKK